MALPMYPPRDGVRLQEPGKRMLEWINGVSPTVLLETVHRICACALKSFTSSRCNWQRSGEEERLTKFVGWKKLNVKSSIRLKTIWFIFYINNHLHFGRKYAQIFIRGHYLFRWVTIWERSSTKTGQISEHIVAPNGGYCANFYWRSLSQHAWFWKLGNNTRIQFPSFSREKFSYLTRLNQSRASENIRL